MRETEAWLGAHPGSEDPVLLRRYVQLAVQAYETEELSEGQLMEILRTDRQRVRQTVEEVRSQTANMAILPPAPSIPR
jgi:hypothetical protein